jgi:gamma-glutamyltranspeptidase
MSGNRDERRSWGVAAPHPAATQAAAAVLSTGGTAVDGALAAAGVLAVVYPHNCSVGGDLIALVRRGEEPPKSVFGVGRAASAIDPEVWRREFGEQVPVTGPLSISVPGVVSGWQALHELGGALPFERLLEPAIALATGGAAVSPSVARALQALDSSDPGLDEIFGPSGNRLGTGGIFVQPRLAETLAEIAADPESYYRGALAERLARGLAAAGSPITPQDFSRHHAVVGEAAMTCEEDLAPRLFTAGLPSQGVFFAGLVRIVGELRMRGYDLLGRDAALLARAFGEISRLRDDFLSDPSRAPAADVLRARLGDVDVFRTAPSAGHAGPLVAEGTAAPSGDTVAVVACDEHGNSVSVLQSVFHSFGSRFLDRATGVLYHNRQSMFTLRPGVPGELEPGLMPPHTLCPVMVDGADGLPSLVLSTMGGRSQPQILAQVLLQLAAGKSATEAVSAPRFLVGDMDTVESHSLVTAEQDLPPGALSALVDGGFDVRIVAGRSEEMGHAQVLRVGSAGVVDAGADPRSDGVATRGG